jgi:hypothetical protein
VSNAPNPHIAARHDTYLQNFIDKLTRRDLAERVAALEEINSELRLRLDAIAQLSASSDVGTEQGA